MLGATKPMAKHGKTVADDLSAIRVGDGRRLRLLAEENTADRWTRWRLALWGLGAVSAVAVSLVALQAYPRRERITATDLARQAEELRRLGADTRREITRLDAAIRTLNADRDRLFARATAIEDGLGRATEAIARQQAATLRPPASGVADASSAAAGAPPGTTGPSAVATALHELQQTPESGRPANAFDAAPASPQDSTPPPAASPSPHSSPHPSPQREPASPPSASPADQTAPDTSTKTEAAPADPAATGSVSPATHVVEVAVPRTQFGVDLGAAASIDGLRGLWRRATAAHKAALADLRPVIALREHRRAAAPATTQLRLIAGPLDDAAAAARICAALAASQQSCEPALFDGQRLALAPEPAAAPPQPQRRPHPRPVRREATTSPRLAPASAIAPTSSTTGNHRP